MQSKAFMVLSKSISVTPLHSVALFSFIESDYIDPKRLDFHKHAILAIDQ